MYYRVMFLAVMASSNWKSVPASSFRVNKPSPGRPALAAPALDPVSGVCDGGKRDKESSQTEKYQGLRVTPNAFVAVRVPSRHIREGLAAVQSGMVEKEKAVQSALTSLDKLHITLSVIRLEDGDEEKYVHVYTVCIEAFL